VCKGAVMRVVSVLSACVLTTCLGGCAVFADPNAWPQKFKYGDSATMASGAGIRFVNEREREMTGREAHPLPTMCTEPSPDVAVAFGTSLAAQANITGQGSGSGSASTSEAALALAGRTASVLALRDGLYATCQAYTNGALGQSAYALGLSQYGNLLVALTAHDAGASGGTSVATGATAAGGAATNTPQTNPPNPALFTPEDSARTALMVACISEYDPTRLGARNPATGAFVTNPVLSQDFCREYLRQFSYKLASAKTK
jgi:hypothetical protein